MTCAGVDGCRAGWVAAPLGAAREFGPLQIYPSFADVVSATADARLTLVDIPIGLADDRCLRTCDLLARERLGPRRSSIFAVPVRAAVHAATYAEACAANHAATGKKISVQSWNICGKKTPAGRAERLALLDRFGLRMEIVLPFDWS